VSLEAFGERVERLRKLTVVYPCPSMRPALPRKARELARYASGLGAWITVGDPTPVNLADPGAARRFWLIWR
jgi:hypothetical protein